MKIAQPICNTFVCINIRPPLVRVNLAPLIRQCKLQCFIDVHLIIHGSCYGPRDLTQTRRRAGLRTIGGVVPINTLSSCPPRHRASHRVWPITRIRAVPFDLPSVALTLPILARLVAARIRLCGRELTLAGTRQSLR